MRYRCLRCKCKYVVAPGLDIECPNCGSKNYKIIDKGRGKDFIFSERMKVLDEFAKSE